MQIPEPIETYGHFWLAGEPNNRLWGLLSVSEKGDAALELFGTLDSPHDMPSWQHMAKALRILGVTDKVGAVTLVDCFVLKQTTVDNIGGQFAKSSLRVGCVFWRAHFDTKEISFSRITFSVEGLDEWFVRHHRPFSSGEDQTGTMSITYSQPEPIEFQIPGDLIISFHMGAGKHVGMFQETINTKMRISIESSQSRSFSEFMQVLRKVKNFLCLSFDRTVSFTSITGYRQESNAPDSLHNTVDIYGRFDPYDLLKQDISPAENFLLSFKEIAHNVHEYLPRWLEHYEEYEPTFDLYFAVTTNRYMHLQGRFLFLVQGIESLHRRRNSETRMPAEEFNALLDTIMQSTPDQWKQWVLATMKYANQPSLRNRIRAMISPFKDLFGNESAQKTFTNQVVNTRNYLTHYDSGIKNEAVTEPQELLQLHSKLEALVQLHLLRLVGIEHAHIRNMATRYPPLRQKLRID